MTICNTMARAMHLRKDINQMRGGMPRFISNLFKETWFWLKLRVGFLTVEEIRHVWCSPTVDHSRTGSGAPPGAWCVSLSVSKMLAYCTCLSFIVFRIAATDGVSDEDRDVTDQFIDNVQQQGKQYRNLVKDGFIYNDSFLVINDYEEILRKGFKNKYFETHFVQNSKAFGWISFETLDVVIQMT